MALLLYNQYTSHGCSYNETHEISQKHEINNNKNGDGRNNLVTLVYE